MQQMIMIKTWQQTLQCELLLASACKVEIEIDDDMIIYDEKLPDGGDPPCPHSNGSFIAHDSDLKLFGALLRYRL